MHFLIMCLSPGVIVQHCADKKTFQKMSHDDILMATGYSLLVLAGVVLFTAIYAACKIESTKSDELRGNLPIIVKFETDFRCGRDRQQRPIKH
jgi:hypothetical protein